MEDIDRAIKEVRETIFKEYNKTKKEIRSLLKRTGAPVTIYASTLKDPYLKALPREF